MCGICGEWRRDGASEARVGRMNATIAHRGPDDSGLIDLGETVLAMRRLSIIDVEHGHQPLANEDESVWVVFNGEIYNHEELRRRLRASGHTLRTHTDTEVLVHLYEEEGPEMVRSLRGMFGFAIWDRRRRRLLLARDRFGQKPMFYSLERDHFVFGSEIKAVVAALDGSPRLDERALDDYLSLRFVPSPSTMLEGVRKLPPAHILVLDAPDAPDEEPKIDVRRYWTLDYVPKQKVGIEDATAELDERMREAVESHLISDVPLGAYLSGGMDSSLIVAYMAQITGEPVQTFSIGVKEQDFNELPFARAVAEHWKTHHREEIVSPDLVQLLPRMVYHLDEPSDPIAACMYHSAQLASRHVKVVLGGDGGDELFAGFDRYYGFSKVAHYAALPEALRRYVLGPVFRRLPDSAGYKNLTQKLRWMDELSYYRGGRRYAQATAFFRFGEDGKEGLYTPEFAERLGGRDAFDCIVSSFDAAHAEHDLDRMLQCDVDTRLAEHSLMLTDRLTMAHGLEGRCPFLDHRLAEYVATLPVNFKMRGRDLKHIMRRVSYKHLPESISRRPKQGFMFPLGYWMKGPLLPVLRQLVGGSAIAEAGIFRPETIDTLISEHVAGRADHHVRLWLLLNLEVWMRLYLKGESADSIAEGFARVVAAA